MSAAFSAIMIVGALVLPAGTRRHDRGVDHAQAVDAVDPQPRIDHRRRRPRPSGRCRPDAGWRGRLRGSSPRTRRRSGPPCRAGFPRRHSGASAGCCGDLARQPHARRQRVEVVLRLEKVERIDGGAERVGALDPHAAARVGAQMHRADAKAGERMRHARPRWSRPAKLQVLKLSWMSGRVRRGSLRAKPPAQMPLLASGPEREQEVLRCRRQLAPTGCWRHR